MSTSVASRPAPRDVQAAVLTKALLRAAPMLGLNGAEIATVLGVSEASVSRLVAGTRQIEPGTKEAELAALLIRCFRSLDALVGGNDAQRLAWMRAHNRVLNATPRSLVATAQGLVTTLAYLDHMRAPA